MDQVAQLIDEDLSTPEIRGMLRLKQVELAERIKEEGGRLAQVEKRLQQLEQVGTQTWQEIAVKEIGSLVVLSAQGIAASEELLVPMRKSLHALLSRNLERARIKPVVRGLQWQTVSLMPRLTWNWN